MLCIHCGTLSESAKLSIIILAGVVVYLKQNPCSSAAATAGSGSFSNLSKTDVFPQICRNENVTVSSVQKYVALKLKLSSKTEVGM
jgi:hypothetical protein